MFPEGRYYKTKSEFDCDGNDFENLYGGSFNKIDGSDFIEWDKNENNDIWSISGDGYEKSYSYDEAIELAGNGCYNINLLVALCLTLLAMTLDMFSFSMVVMLSSCDLHLTLGQTSILMSIPFVGAITMSYTWGYISDTQGRRSSLLVAMSASFLMSVLCAFAPNWIFLAVFKLIGTCFSCCAQSTTYILLGESCSERVKATYIQIMSSVVYLAKIFYYSLAHSMSYIDFSYDLGFITFTPWRLLVLILAVPLGLSALSLLFFYESPKFLLNAGQREKALQLLKNIRRRNGLEVESYPVKNLVLKETGNVWCAEVSLLWSMWRLTKPLFRPPHLKNTLLLYFLLVIIYSTANTVSTWLPYLAKDLSTAITNDKGQDGLCSFVTMNTTAMNATETCRSTLDLSIVLFVVPFSTIMFMFSFAMSKLAKRKKALMISIFLASSASCVGTVLVPNIIADLVLYMTIASVSICGGLVASYCVDLYPTSFRGTASCLGVMVSRASIAAGVNFIGPHFFTSCETTFFSIAGMLLSGAIAACFLPPDSPKKK